MTSPAITRSGPRGWAAEVVTGLYRSAVLAGLTAPVPVLGAAVAFFGAEFAFTWTAQLHAPLIVRVLARIGEILMAAVWTGVAAWLATRRGSRPLSQAARAFANDWLGLRLEVRYQPPPPLTRMATGYWWNGYEYYKSEREARWQARMEHGIRDPQHRRDIRWVAVSTTAVLPTAVLPLLGLAAGSYLTLQPGLAAYGAVIIVAGLAAAPFGWRAFGPLAARYLGPAPQSRVEELESIQADMTQTQAAELERIERGLHDGPQARIVALGMSMGAAEQLLDTNPEAARAILAEARASSAAALDELRALARGINPPVLTERGLVDAVRALALDASVPVDVRSDLPARPERPVESAVYFAVSELLANAVKHARATGVSVDLGYGRRTLTATVTDDGKGGAVAAPGSGLHGIERRMAAFDGRLEIDSPAGGPTRITVAVPCALS
jgi:signal transduction histidine kinase